MGLGEVGAVRGHGLAFKAWFKACDTNPTPTLTELSYHQLEGAADPSRRCNIKASIKMTSLTSLTLLPSYR